mgnify:CR=1 FL=1
MSSTVAEGAIADAGIASAMTVQATRRGTPACARRPNNSMVKDVRSTR